MQKIIPILLVFWCGVLTAQEEPKKFSDNVLKPGTVFISTTFSINHNQGENQTPFLQKLDNNYNLDWDVTLRSGYFIKKDFVIGGFFKYASRLNESIYQVDGNSVKNHRLEREFSVAPFIRNYLPLGNGRFVLFNETNLEFTYGSGVQQVYNVDDVTRSVGQSYGLKLGIQPGISAFITEKTAFEVGTSLLGLSSSYTRTQVNGSEDGYSFSNDVSFKIDLLSLFLGVTFYISGNEN